MSQVQPRVVTMTADSSRVGSTESSAAGAAEPGDRVLLDDPIWTRPYISLGFVVFLNYLNQSAIRPLVPLYILYLGGSESLAGVALFTFSVVSFSLRPSLGRLIDNSEAARVMILGTVGLAVFTSAMAVEILWVAILMFTVRGAGWAGINASSTALLAHLAPPARRGEASGYYSLFQSSATTLGPAVALYWVTRTENYLPVFMATALCCVIALPLCGALRNVEERRTGTGRKPSPNGDRRESKWVARSALVPSVLLIFLTLPQAAVLGFFPLYGESIGLSPLIITAFYVISGVGALAGRAVLGRVSDTTGRGSAILAGFVMVGLSLVAILQADLVPLLLASAALFSLGQAMTLPAVTALAIDRAGEGEVGHSMATFSASFQVGLGGGGLLAGIMIEQVGYAPTYATMAVFMLGAIGVTIRLWRNLSTESRMTPKG
jgi:MFS family permease